VYNSGDTVIHLKPYGVPVDTGTYVFSVTFDNDVCSFNVNIQDSTGTGLGGTGSGTTIPDNTSYLWKFIDSTNHINFIGPLTGTLSISGSTGILSMKGITATHMADTSLYIYLEMGDTSLANIVPADFITTGNNSLRFATSTANIYKADATTTQKITIRLIDYSANVLTGWFFGTAADKDGHTVRIENATFNVPG
jgi:hypothetical protein